MTMSFEEACNLLGYDKPPILDKESQSWVIEWVEEETKDGTKPLTIQQANVARAQIDEFA